MNALHFSDYPIKKSWQVLLFRVQNTGMLSYFLMAMMQKAPDVPNLPNKSVIDFAINPVPQRNKQKIAPIITDSENLAYIVKDAKSGKILLSENAEKIQPIASISKLMTVLVALQSLDVNKVVTVPLWITNVQGASMELVFNEEITVKDLLSAALIPSANDAATLLAVTAAGTEAEFVKKMNQKAKEMGMKSALFYNATGLPFIDKNGEEKHNRMTAKDVLQLAETAMANSFIRNNVKQTTFEATSVDGRFFHTKTNTNQLLGSFLNVKGIKTGYTEAAGQCVVTLSQMQNPHQLYAVVLGSNDRFGTTKKLLSWAWDSFEW